MEKSIVPDLWGGICERFFETGAGEYDLVRDDGYRRTVTAASYFAETSALRREVFGRLRGKRMLDIGCGPGSDLLFMQRAGADAHGLDSSEKCLAVAARRGCVNLHRLPADRAGGLGIKFDSVVMLGNNVGIIGDPGRTEEFFRGMRDWTGENAVFIGHGLDYRSDREVHLRYQRENALAGRYPGETRIREEYGDSASGWFRQYLFAREDLRGMLERAGWKVEAFIDDVHNFYYTVALKG